MHVLQVPTDHSQPFLQASQRCVTSAGSLNANELINYLIKPVINEHGFMAYDLSG